MPIVLSEGSSKKSTHIHSQKKAPTANNSKISEKTTPSTEESEEETQSCSDLHTATTSDQKVIQKTNCEIPVYEDYLPNADEALDNKINWLIQQRLSTLAKHSSPSSSDLDITSTSEDDTASEESEKSSRRKKMKKTNGKKKPPQKRKTKTKKAKKSTSKSSADQKKRLTKLVTFLAKSIKN